VLLSHCALRRVPVCCTRSWSTPMIARRTRICWGWWNGHIQRVTPHRS